MISSWAIYTKRIDIQSVYVCSFLKTAICIDVFFLMYHLYFMFTNYSCKYHQICQNDHDMYVMKYIGMMRIYISQVSTMSAQNRYIYKVQY